MAKRNISRLVAAILTLALAFSVMAMPASAAKGYQLTLGDGEETMTVIVSVDAIPVLAAAAVDQYDEELPAAVSTALNAAVGLAGTGVGKLILKNIPLKTIQSVAQQIAGEEVDLPISKYEGEIPSGASLGIIGTAGNAPVWYTEAETEQMADAMMAKMLEKEGSANFSIDAATGVVTLGDKELGTSDVSQLPQEKDNTLLYVVGGVVVAAGVATGVYFYTHPEAWNKVTTTVQNTWNKLTGKAVEETPAEEIAAEEPAEGEAAAAQAEPAESTATQEQAEQTAPIALSQVA